MAALDAFSLSPEDWEDVEASYEAALSETSAEAAAIFGMDQGRAEGLLVRLLQNTTTEQQKWLALGIVVGRASAGAKDP